MEITIESKFNTPIFHCSLEHDNKYLAKYCKDLSIQESGIIATNVKGWHSEPYFLHTCKNDSLIELANKVLNATNDVCDYIKIRPNLRLKMKEFWINVSPKGSRNMSHDHPASDFSAVYYVQAESNSGNIGFGNPSQIMEFWWRSRVIQKESIMTSPVTYKPIVGKLIIFPSWLVHHVQQNNSNTDRISLAFNMALYNTDDYIQ